MRVTAKATLALLLAIGGVLVAYGYTERARQNERFERNLRESQLTVGRLFRPTIARAWRTDGKASAMYLIEYTKQTLRSEKVASRFDIRWVWLDAEPDDGHAPAVPMAALQPVLAGGEVTTTMVSERGETRMVSYVPLVVGIEGERPGALEISSSMQPLRAFVADTEKHLVSTIGIVAVLCAVLSLAVGAWFVGRPVRRLIDAARRIGAGDLPTPLALRQRDELGKLAREMDGMRSQLGVARDQIEDETQARIQAIEQMRHADRLATVGKLASGIAHELGTPLAVVGGRAKLIGNRTVSGEETIEYAHSIARQADRMAVIIRQLLDFARRRTVTMSSKDMRPLIRQTTELLGPLGQKTGVTLVVEAPEAPVRALVDGAQLQQVITNLVVNAVYASEPRGEVTVGLESRHVAAPKHDSARPGEYVRVWVQDRGNGIDDATCERMFEPFFTTKPVGEGTGLGLAVSYGIVADHGGWIDVHSRVGEGSTFSVYVPAAVDAAPGNEEVSCPDAS